MSGRRERNFTVVSNSVLRDARLSFRARGLLAFILSQPDNFRVGRAELTDFATEGREAIHTALSELETAGYLVRQQQVRSEDGTFEYESIVYDEPVPPDMAVES